MVKKLENREKASVKEYKADQNNQGKVAIFDFEKGELVAEGDSGADWLELELLCERMREEGDYRIVIVPEASPSIKMFRRVLA